MAREKKVVKDPMISVMENLAKSIGYKEKDPLIFRFGDVETQGIEAISFGYPEIDEASAIGGIQRGKLVEIFGLPSSGKSYLTLKLIKSAQDMGLKCLLCDVEQSFDPVWARKHEVDVDNLYLINAAISAENYMDLVDGACKTGEFGLVVIDSTAALIPEKEMDGSVGDQDYALLARIMSKGCKKLVSSCAKGNTACVFINQVRANIKQGGQRNAAEYVTPGGNALDFFSHQRVSVWPGGMIKALGKDGEEQSIGKKSYVKFVKNKLGNPDKKCEIQIVFDESAMNPIVKMVTLAKTYGIFSVRLGNYYISKDFVEDQKKNYNTLAEDFGELAHWVMSNGYLENVLDALKKLIEDEENEDKLKLIDPIIYQLIETDEDNEFINKELWISPLGDYSIPTDPDIALKKDKDSYVSSGKPIENLSELVKNGKGDILEQELDLE